jgi:hypothetical protein
MVLLLETYKVWNSACEEKILTEHKDLCRPRSTAWIKLLSAEERRF